MADVKYKILIVDDELEIRDVLRLYLENAGYLVTEAEDGEVALSQLQKKQEHPVDLAVVDIMMPRMDGFHLVKKLREFSRIPVLMLSAKGEDEDKILGLGLGADDYLTKPFNPLEVVARIGSQLRRAYAFSQNKGEENRLKVKSLTLDLDSCVLFKENEPIELTSIEFRLMKLFMEHPGKVFTKQQLFETGWEEEYVVADNTIMVCISKLRAKLAKDGTEYIRTIRGLGYRFEQKG